MQTLLARLPVYDSVLVQKHQGRCDLSGVESRSCLIKLPRSLNLKHQVATIDVLHHEEQPVLEKEQETECHSSFGCAVQLQVCCKYLMKYFY